mmetsp:Transcript_119888/g.274698  ORF Transcript_119888/g.274698 Transcript_119888/m.274698 type:complete len:315 (-) Transcript_119888:615-1559(-)
MKADTLAFLLRLAFFLWRGRMKAAAAHRAAVSWRCCSQALLAGVNQLTPTGAASAATPSFATAPRPSTILRADTGAARVVPTGGVSHPDSVSDSVSVEAREQSLDPASESGEAARASAPARRGRVEAGGGPAGPGAARTSAPARAGAEDAKGPVSAGSPLRRLGPGSEPPQASRRTRRFRRRATKGSSGSAGAVGGAGRPTPAGSVRGAGCAAAAGSSGAGGSGTGSGRGMMRRSARGCGLSPYPPTTARVLCTVTAEAWPQRPLHFTLSQCRDPKSKLYSRELVPSALFPPNTITAPPRASAVWDEIGGGGAP